MTDEQTRDLVETLWQLDAAAAAEADRWRDNPQIASGYRGQRTAYGHVLELIAAIQPETPANPEHPPAPASSYVERGD